MKGNAFASLSIDIKHIAKSQPSCQGRLDAAKPSQDPCPLPILVGEQLELTTRAEREALALLLLHHTAPANTHGTDPGATQALQPWRAKASAQSGVPLCSIQANCPITPAAQKTLSQDHHFEGMKGDR